MSEELTRLARESLASAQQVRRQRQRSILDPVCIYDLSADMGLDVWFQKIASLEGMYVRLSPPRIFLGAERPAGRRAYTCAHELGHHVLGHGTKVDELREECGEPGSFEPEEYQAQVFAGMLLMPKLALASALSERGWSPETANAEDLYCLASLFGVGFESIIRHMQFGVGMLPRHRAEAMARIRLPEVRAALAGAEQAAYPLVVVDALWRGRPVDVEVGDRLLTPRDFFCEGTNLHLVTERGGRKLWQALSPGRCRFYLRDRDWGIFVRVSRKCFEGRSQFRHEPEVPGDE